MYFPLTWQKLACRTSRMANGCTAACEYCPHGHHPSGLSTGVLPLCYLFQVSSASLGTGLSSGKPGDSLEPSCARADKANRAALEAAELSRGVFCRGHICLHPLLGSSMFTTARAQNQNKESQSPDPEHKESAELVRCLREFLPLFCFHCCDIGDPSFAVSVLE